MARTIGSYGPKTMEAIRKAGLRLIFEHGYEAMSLRQLAAEVGIQAGSLYNHISTKQELLFDLVRDHINELLRQLDRALAGKLRPSDKLRAFTAFHVTYHMTRKREVFIANSELRSLEPKNYEAIVALRGPKDCVQETVEVTGEAVATDPGCKVNERPAGKRAPAPRTCPIVRRNRPRRPGSTKRTRSWSLPDWPQSRRRA